MWKGGSQFVFELFPVKNHGKDLQISSNPESLSSLVSTYLSGFDMMDGCSWDR